MTDPALDDLALAIGHVVLADVQLEQSARRLAVVLSVDALLTGQTDPETFPGDLVSLIDYIDRWLPARLSGRTERWDKAKATALGAHALRNRFVHDEWVGEWKPECDAIELSTFRYKANKAMPYTAAARTVDDVNQTALRLRLCANVFEMLAYAVVLAHERAGGGFSDNASPSHPES